MHQYTCNMLLMAGLEEKYNTYNCNFLVCSTYAYSLGQEEGLERISLKMTFRATHLCSQHHCFSHLQIHIQFFLTCVFCLYTAAHYSFLSSCDYPHVFLLTSTSSYTLTDSKLFYKLLNIGSVCYAAWNDVCKEKAFTTILTLTWGKLYCNLLPMKLPSCCQHVNTDHCIQKYHLFLTF